MLGIAILFSVCCSLRSPLPALLPAPYTLLPGGNDMGHGRSEGSRVLRVSGKAEGHIAEGRWERYSVGEDAAKLREGGRVGRRCLTRFLSNKPPGAPSALVKEVEIEANRRPRQIKPGVL